MMYEMLALGDVEAESEWVPGNDDDMLAPGANVEDDDNNTADDNALTDDESDVSDGSLVRALESSGPKIPFLCAATLDVVLNPSRSR